MAGVDGGILLVTGALILIVGVSVGWVIRGAANDPGGLQARVDVRSLQRHLATIREEIFRVTKQHPGLERLRSLVERRTNERKPDRSGPA